ncbi:PD40 domain-containing protein [Streptomyces syringium]|uniref:Tol biopolymer transport system component n=1 Tax=Streptomyces syringium TaxID=76729 RepID=A0ABS4XWZ0_9ACTN|nr:PD40 domain-containing protein [Streptomyces syringium]MBP2401034.1 Tol biopolymer transport system component [Streptomyces syringium]
MRYLIRTAVVAAVLGTCATVPPVAAATERHQGRTERVSVAADGTEANGESGQGKISGDGRVVVFSSGADNLIPGDTRKGGPFVKDLRTGRVERVSVATDGTPGDGSTWDAAVSGNGRYVVFSSDATNLVPGGNPTGSTEVYVRDRRTGRTDILIGDPKQGRVQNSEPSISADGRFVAFLSTRSDLVPGDTNDVRDVFVKDRWRGTVKRVSVASDGTQGNGESVSPVISANGSRVGFKSRASNLTPQAGADEEALARPRARVFYAHELRTGRTELAARSLTGSRVAVLTDIGLSPDGRYALFLSSNVNIVAGDTNHTVDAFATDLRTGVTRRLSVAADGSEANDMSYGHVAMSADNRYAFFPSSATNLVPGDTNGKEDVFVRDLRTGAVERVNVASDGRQADEFSLNFSVDLAGRRAVFDSGAGNLVPQDGNGGSDVFLRRLR